MSDRDTLYWAGPGFPLKGNRPVGPGRCSRFGNLLRHDKRPVSSLPLFVHRSLTFRARDGQDESLPGRRTVLGRTLKWLEALGPESPTAERTASSSASNYAQRRLATFFSPSSNPIRENRRPKDS